MSTSTDGQSHRPRKYHTVAELIARERSGSVLRRTAEPASTTRSRALTPVTELLRREGVDFCGDDAKTVEFPAAKPPAEVALSGRAATSKRTSHRAAAIGNAAALVGLTVAGFVALTPTIENGPGDAHPAAPADATATDEEGVEPTTTVLRREDSGTARLAGSSTTSASPTAARHAPVAQVDDASPAAAEPTRKPATTTVASEPVASPSTTPAQSEPSAKPTKPPRSDEPEDTDGGNDSGTLIDTVGEVLAPVTDTVTGTLGLGG